MCLISIQLWGCNYHTSFALGTDRSIKSGGLEASSDQSNTDAPHLTHQHCGCEGQKLYNTSPMPTAPGGNEGMLAGTSMSQSHVYTTSTRCRLGTVQTWLRRLLLTQDEKPPLHCSLQIPLLWLQQPSWPQDSSRWRWCMTVAGGWRRMTLLEDCVPLIQLSVHHGMFHDRCVVYVCLKNLTFNSFILAQI